MSAVHCQWISQVSGEWSPCNYCHVKCCTSSRRHLYGHRLPLFGLFCFAFRWVWLYNCRERFLCTSAMYRVAAFGGFVMSAKKLVDSAIVLWPYGELQFTVVVRWEKLRLFPTFLFWKIVCNSQWSLFRLGFWQQSIDVWLTRTFDFVWWSLVLKTLVFQYFR